MKNDGERRAYLHNLVYHTAFTAETVVSCDSSDWPVPEFTRSLDAMHELEVLLTREEYASYIDNLLWLLVLEADTADKRMAACDTAIVAPAAMRAEAMALTLGDVHENVSDKAPSAPCPCPCCGCIKHYPYPGEARVGPEQWECASCGNKWYPGTHITYEVV